MNAYFQKFGQQIHWKTMGHLQISFYFHYILLNPLGILYYILWLHTLISASLVDFSATLFQKEVLPPSIHLCTNFR